jgi:hypothetical protein
LAAFRTLGVPHLRVSANCPSSGCV